jgi:hypothetical protein
VFLPEDGVIQIPDFGAHSFGVMESQDGDDCNTGLLEFLFNGIPIGSCTLTRGGVGIRNNGPSLTYRLHNKSIHTKMTRSIIPNNHSQSLCQPKF